MKFKAGDRFIDDYGDCGRIISVNYPIRGCYQIQYEGKLRESANSLWVDTHLYDLYSSAPGTVECAPPDCIVGFTITPKKECKCLSLLNGHDQECPYPRESASRT